VIFVACSTRVDKVITGQKMDAPPKGYFRLANRNFPKKPWYKDPALRKTYICLMFVVVTSVRSLVYNSYGTECALT
jgi:hypothetical protein